MLQVEIVGLLFLFLPYYLLVYVEYKQKQLVNMGYFINNFYVWLDFDIVRLPRLEKALV